MFSSKVLGLLQQHAVCLLQWDCDCSGGGGAHAVAKEVRGRAYGGFRQSRVSPERLNFVRQTLVIRGTDNAVADALSRMDVSKDNLTEVRKRPMEVRCTSEVRTANCTKAHTEKGELMAHVMGMPKQDRGLEMPDPDNNVKWPSAMHLRKTQERNNFR